MFLLSLFLYQAQNLLSFLLCLDNYKLQNMNLLEQSNDLLHTQV